jgi:hypothetical protein
VTISIAAAAKVMSGQDCALSFSGMRRFKNKALGVLQVYDRTTIRPMILPALSSSNVRLTSDNGRVSTGIGFSFPARASATTALIH